MPLSVGRGADGSVVVGLVDVVVALADVVVSFVTVAVTVAVTVPVTVLSCETVIVVTLRSVTVQAPGPSTTVTVSAAGHVYSPPPHRPKAGLQPSPQYSVVLPQ